MHTVHTRDLELLSTPDRPARREQIHDSQRRQTDEREDKTAGFCLAFFMALY